jgi:hypothetical protein
MFMVCDCITKCLKRSKYEEIDGEFKIQKYLWYLLLFFIYCIHNIHNFIGLYQTYTFDTPLKDNCTIVITNIKNISWFNLTISFITCILFVTCVVDVLQNKKIGFGFERLIFLLAYTLYATYVIYAMIITMNTCVLDEFTYLIYLHIIYVVYIYIISVMIITNVMAYIIIFTLALWGVWYSIVGRDYD